MKMAFLPLLIALPLLAADLEFKEGFADPATREASLEKLIIISDDRPHRHFNVSHPDPPPTPSGSSCPPTSRRSRPTPIRL